MPNEKILIVENDAFIAESLGKIISSFGYTIAGVTYSGENAINMAKSNNPDLVLMDIGLKGPVDCLKATNKILADQDLPIIYLIPHTEEVLIIRVKDIMPYGFLTKPVDEQKLYSIVRRAIIYHTLAKNFPDDESLYYTYDTEGIFPIPGKNYSQQIQDKRVVSLLQKSKWISY